MRKADPDLHRRRTHEIIEAATGCFLAQGFHQTSMADLAAAAGVSMGLLYRYFANKDALIIAAAKQDRDAMLLDLGRLGEASDAAMALRHFARDQVRQAAIPGYMPLLCEVLAESCRNPAIADLVAADDQALRDGLVAALARLQARGRIRPDRDLAGFAGLYLSLIDGMTSRAHIDPAFDPDRTLDLFMPVMEGLAGLAHDTPPTSINRGSEQLPPTPHRPV